MVIEMRNGFEAFYEPSDSELRSIWLSENTMFVIDTSALLNLYYYSENTTKHFLESLSTVSDRAWLPHHVALEYHRNRKDQIKRENSLITQVYDKIKGITKTCISSRT